MVGQALQELGVKAPEGITETEDQTEAPAEEAQEQPEQDPITRKWAGVFESPEELEKGFIETKQKLGQQGNELGQLRREFEQLRGQVPQQPAFSHADEEAWDEILEEDPQRAFHLARERGDGLRMQKSLKDWFDADPYEATEARLELERDYQRSIYEQQLGRYETGLQTQTLAQAVNAVKSRNPDYAQLQPLMLQAAERAPHLIEPLKNGDQGVKEQVINNLLLIARGLAAGEPASPGATETEQPVPHVASAGVSPSGEPAKKVDPLFALAQRLVDEETLPE